jgi:hypothetical protein
VAEREAIPDWLEAELRRLIDAGEAVPVADIKRIIGSGNLVWREDEAPPLLAAPRLEPAPPGRAPLGAETLAKVRRRVQAAVDDHLEIWAPAFLGGTWLARLSRQNARGLVEDRHVLLTDDGLEDGPVVELNGRSEQIHGWNPGKLQLFEVEAAVDYLKFFCHFVRADEGPFRIVEPDDPRLDRLAGDGAARAAFCAAFRAHVRAPRVQRFGLQGEIFIDASVHYGQALFGAKFVVFPDGKVEMLDDDLHWPNEEAAAVECEGAA